MRRVNPASLTPLRKTHQLALVAAAAVCFAAIITSSTSNPTAHAEAPSSHGAKESKSIRLSEIQQHGRNAERRWVMRGNRVYDIEDWITNHPGTL